MLPFTPTFTYIPGALAPSRGWCGPALGAQPPDASPVSCGLTPARCLLLVSSRACGFGMPGCRDQMATAVRRWCEKEARLVATVKVNSRGRACHEHPCERSA